MSNIFIYAGYSPGKWNGSNYQNVLGCRGSEIALVHIAEQLAKTHKVTVSFDPILQGEHNGVNYIQPTGVQEYLDSTEIDVLIISRYIHFFIKYTNTAKKTYLWLHDYTAAPYYYGSSLPNDGIPIVKNSKIDGIITLTNWHKNYVSNYYNIDSGISVIGNGINPIKFKNYNANNKIPNRFVFFSGNGGLQDAIKWFLKFREHRPDASLHVFMETSNIGDWELSTVEHGVVYRGFVSNDELISELLISEYWLYPAVVNETYCTSILEAKAAGCIPIVRPLGGMHEVIGDLYFDIDDEYSVEKVLDIQDPGIIIEHNRKNALQFSWEHRALEWKNLLSI
jgi:glycosyltransferase involved in cell wall biosynthesis